MGKLIAKLRKLLKRDRIKRSKKTVADALPKREDSTTLRNRMNGKFTHRYFSKIDFIIFFLYDAMAALKVQIDRMLAYQDQLMEQIQSMTGEQLQK